MKQKWGKVIGPAAFREWQLHVAVTKDRTNLKQQAKPKGLLKILSSVRPFSWIRSPKVDETATKQSSVHADSIMSWYLALETGRFWLPAQVYNREVHTLLSFIVTSIVELKSLCEWRMRKLLNLQNGHVGFMLSCYDAELSYDAHTDTFSAR